MFEPAETVNQSYLSLVRIMNKTMPKQPELVPALLQNLEKGLKGQNISLVFRTDVIQHFRL